MAGDNKNNDAMLIAIRAIVMFFGLSMVILGSHAIKARHGSLSKYLKSESQPLINKVENKLPKVEWNRMSNLFKLERAKQTWNIKANKLSPKNEQKDN